MGDWDRLYFDNAERDDLQYVNFSARCVALFAGFLILILSSIRKAGVLTIESRGAKICFQIAALLWLVGLGLGIGALVGAVDNRDFGPGGLDRKQMQTLSTLASTFQLQAFTVLLVSQLELGIGLRHIGAADGARVWAHPIRYGGIASCIAITLVNVGRLAAFLVQAGSDTDDVSWDAVRAAMALDFVLCLLLAIFALSIAVYTFSKSPALYRNIYMLLGMAAFLTLASAVYRVVIAGIYSLDYLKSNDGWHETPDALPVAAVFIQSWMPLAAMIFILVAFGKGSMPLNSKA